MVIVILPEWYSENMGYVENHLPPALQRLGCEVHVVTSDMQIYATSPQLYKSVYESFLGPSILATGSKQIKGCTLHRLASYKTRFGIGLQGLFEKLKEIKPDIIYLFEINTEHTLQVVKFKPALGYKIFTESRLHLSVYSPPKNFKLKVKQYFKWMVTGWSFEKCYPIAPDVLYVITKFFGQTKAKCKLSSLAVDTDTLKPLATIDDTINRNVLRTELGFANNDIVCIYTGRFTDDKGTIILAKAIDYLHSQGHPYFKGLFIGGGDAVYESNIVSHRGCQIYPFVKSDKLVGFYQAAEIGIWPKQESTSQLDAIACGLPIIISSNVEDVERINGNGRSYHHEDPIDLAKQIVALKESALREKLGRSGAMKIKEFYSWDFIAKSRLKDFVEATQ